MSRLCTDVGQRIGQVDHRGSEDRFLQIEQQLDYVEVLDPTAACVKEQRASIKGALRWQTLETVLRSLGAAGLMLLVGLVIQRGARKLPSRQRKTDKGRGADVRGSLVGRELDTGSGARSARSGGGHSRGRFPRP